MKRILILLVSVLILSVTYAQDYKEMMNDPSVNVYDVIKEAEAYYKTHDKGKGTGWKEYQRWKYFSESRFYPSGDRAVAIGNKTINRFLETSMQKAKDGTVELGTWTELGPVEPRYDEYFPIHGTGRTEVVWVDPQDDNYIYAASRTGGFWKTTDGGETWVSSTQGLAVIGCNGLDAYSADRNIVYLGSSGGTDYWNPYGLGVLKSIDGGDSWQSTSLDFVVEDNFNVRKILIHPTNPDIVYVATNKGLYKTTDGFSTHSLIKTGSCVDIELQPDNPRILYTSIGKYIYKSTNSGQAFSLISGIRGELISVSKANSSYVYVSNGETIYRSKNSGDSFISKSVSSGAWGAFCASDTDADVLFNGSNTIHMSKDGGDSFSEVGSKYGWFPLNNYSGWDHRYVTCVNGTFYTCNDANLNFTTDNGDTWGQILHGNIGLRDNYSFASSKTKPYHILTGSQDHGTYKFTDGYWTKEMGGDGMMCAFDIDDEDIYFMTYQYGNLQRRDHGQAKNISPDKGNWITPVVVDPVLSNTIYAAYDTIYRSNNNGDSWSQIGDFGSVGNLNNMAVAATNNQYIYVTYQHRIWVTKNGGTNNSWTEITSGLPQLWINFIEIDPKDENILYVTLSGYNNGIKVFKSIDAGISWVNISKDLPNIPALTIAADTTEYHGLYVGMDMGVFYTNDTITSWMPFNEGMPKVTARILEIDNSIGKIRVATWGRGLWESDLYAAEKRAPKPLFTVDSKDVYPASSVQFTDRSSGTPESWSWTFEGGEPESSDEQYPSVVYNEVGEFDVSLTVTNTNGSTQTTEQDYIHVTEPTYCSSSGASYTTSDYISRVTFADMDNSSDKSGYSDFTNITATVKTTQDFTLLVTMKFSWDLDEIYAWADWNNDFVFSADELIMSGDPNISHTYSSVITIPEDAKLGTTRLRVRTQYSTAPGSPCGDGFAGEVEDYTLIVQKGFVSVDNMDEQNMFAVYPNPASEKLYVKSMSSGPVSVTILDMFGRKVLSRSCSIISNNTYEIPISNISNGLYLVRVSDGVNTITNKVTIWQ